VVRTKAYVRTKGGEDRTQYIKWNRIILTANNIGFFSHSGDEVFIVEGSID